MIISHITEKPIAFSPRNSALKHPVWRYTQYSVACMVLESFYTPYPVWRPITQRTQPRLGRIRPTYNRLTPLNAGIPVSTDDGIEDVSVLDHVRGLASSQPRHLSTQESSSSLLSYSSHGLTENQASSVFFIQSNSFPHYLFVLQRPINHEVFYSPRCQHAGLGYGRDSQDAFEKDASD